MRVPRRADPARSRAAGETRLLWCLYLDYEQGLPVGLLTIAVRCTESEVEAHATALARQGLLQSREPGWWMAADSRGRDGHQCPVSVADRGYWRWKRGACGRLIRYLHALAHPSDSAYRLRLARDYGRAVPALIRQATALGWPCTAIAVGVAWQQVADDVRATTTGPSHDAWVDALHAATLAAGRAVPHLRLRQLRNTIAERVRLAGNQLGEHISRTIQLTRGHHRNPSPRPLPRWCATLRHRVTRGLRPGEPHSIGAMAAPGHRALITALLADLDGTSTPGTSLGLGPADRDILLDRMLWQLGREHNARRCWTRAREQLAALGDPRGEDVSVLLALSDGADVPDDPVLAARLSAGGWLS